MSSAPTVPHRLLQCPRPPPHGRPVVSRHRRGAGRGPRGPEPWGSCCGSRVHAQSKTSLSSRDAASASSLPHRPDPAPRPVPSSTPRHPARHSGVLAPDADPTSDYSCPRARTRERGDAHSGCRTTVAASRRERPRTSVQTTWDRVSRSEQPPEGPAAGCSHPRTCKASS